MPTKKSSSPTPQVPVAVGVEDRILIIRGQKVMLDADLAELYGVTTFNLNKAVKRNRDRFPVDFMFQLTKEEVEPLRFQIGMSKKGRGGRRYLPYVFTEHGAVMLASALNSKTAVEASIQVVRAFVQLRSILAAHKELARKIDALSKSTDQRFQVVFDLVKKHLPPYKPGKRIGFDPNRK